MNTNAFVYDIKTHKCVRKNISTLKQVHRDAHKDAYLTLRQFQYHLKFHHHRNPNLETQTARLINQNHLCQNCTHQLERN